MRESESAGAHGVNAQGIQIAARVEELHCSALNLTRDTALTEDGALVAPTRCDILTGSNPDGTLVMDLSHRSALSERRLSKSDSHSQSHREPSLASAPSRC
jgi:hypothetical protein